VDTPVAGDGELLVRVHATTVNRTDCGYRAASPFFIRASSGLRTPRAKILGTEYAGVIEALGAGVTSFAAGDRVFGWCEGGLGAHAEYVTVRADSMLATIPARLTFVEAAPSTEGSHYALAFVRRAGIRSGQRVLVNGATGAIGSAAVQLLASMGAVVTGVCATEHLDLVKGLGAQRVIDYTREDFTRDHQTYDVVIDAVGKSTFGRCRRLLGPRGRYLSSDLGPGWQNLVLPLVTPLLRGRKVVFPLPKEDREVIAYLRALLESGRFTPVVDRTYTLDEIVDAYRYVETGQKLGNVVIVVLPD
jgi:NADPH:quinone reductase-like Zn-dependent oxidoreductase